MKLAIIYHVRFNRTEGGYKAISGGFCEYVYSFAPYFEEIVLCVPVGSFANDKNFTSLSCKNVRFCELPSYERYELELLLKPICLIKGIGRAVKDADIINPRIPGLIGLIGGFLALFYKKPAFLSVVGDWKEASLKGASSRGAKKILLKAIVSLSSLLLQVLIRRFVSFVTGEELYHKYKIKSPLVFQASNPTFRQNDIIARHDTCLNKELIRLLYVGVLSPVKGLTYLLDAFREVRNQGFPVVLTLVGEGNIRNMLVQKSEEFRISPFVTFKGQVGSRTDLFELYESSDIFILPSLSEGTPRVLLEAMAMGVPVIASNVGGIPSLVENGDTGLLVSPKSPSEMSKAIIKIIKDGKLRRKIIENGRKMAEEHTMERETEMKIQVLKKYNLYPRV